MQFVIYSAIGVINTLTDFLLLIVQVEVLRMPLYYAIVASFLIASIVSYTLNKKITFKSKGSFRKEYPKFILTSTVGLILNLSIVHALQYMLHYTVAKLIATFFVLIWNFVISKFWTYASQK